MYSANFSRRNRLIAALSDAVAVIQAGEKSGSLTTAAHALNQGKDVFAVAGNICDARFFGSHKLIEDGAIPITSVDSIIRYYMNDSRVDLEAASKIAEKYKNMHSHTGSERDTGATQKEKSPPRADADIQKLENLGHAARTVYSLLTDEYQHIDIMIEKSGLPEPAVLSALTMLEIEGLIQSASGKQYRKG